MSTFGASAGSAAAAGPGARSAKWLGCGPSWWASRSTRRQRGVEV